MQQAGLGSVKEAGPLGRRDEARGEALDEWAVNAAVFYSLVHEAEDIGGRRQSSSGGWRIRRAMQQGKQEPSTSSSSWMQARGGAGFVGRGGRS